jgi:hypothetical protein
MRKIPFSLYPDYTVGPGIKPGLLTFRRKAESARGLGIAAITAGGELHPALRTLQRFTPSRREKYQLSQRDASKGAGGLKRPAGQAHQAGQGGAG